MFERIIALFPEHWQNLVEILLAPVSWIPMMQRYMLEFFLDSPSGLIATFKFLFLLFPVLLWIAAIWCTQMAIYTVPFRSRRLSFFSLMLVAWWDGARAVWWYWVGLFRFMVVAVGWLFTLIRLGVKMIVESGRQLIIVPFTLTGRMTQSYFQPGVPWIAFLMLLFWCLIEATIFTYILFPTVSEVLIDLVGVGAPKLTGPVLFLFLSLLILGSFACLDALLESIKNREAKFLVQMIMVELFVMFFEVLFLYRELVDAITPWIAQQTDERFRMGIIFTMTIATFGWIGIRGMTWFLFGKYGTPPLVAFISRRPMVHGESTESPDFSSEVTNWWRAPFEDFKREIGWIHEKSDELLEYVTLPVLQVIGAAFNFAMILVLSRPVFSLPFKNLKEVMETRELLSAMHLHSKKVGS